MRKIGLSLVLVGILGATNAVAETDGKFIGAFIGNGSSKMTLEVEGASASESMSGVRYGVVVGTKQFFTPEFGARYYALFDAGSYEKSGTTMDTDNISANADALYNFLSKENMDFGAFAGLSLGYAISGNTTKVHGLDVGINLGLRVNIATHHGIELYSRFGLTEQKKDETIETAYFKYTQTLKVKQPSQFGVRYTFSF